MITTNPGCPMITTNPTCSRSPEKSANGAAYTSMGRSPMLSAQKNSRAENPIYPAAGAGIKIWQQPAVRRAALVFIALSLAILFCAPFASAQIESNLPGAGFDQPKPTKQSSVPTLKVYSRETVIDVVATDGKGQPVTGLQQSDFTVLEDGKPQPLRSFRENTTTAPPAQRPLPPNTYTNAQALPTTGPVQIFLIDLVRSSTENIVRSRPYIADYFRTMPAGTQVAIFLLSPTKGLMLVQGFTTDGNLAASVLDKHTDAEWYVPPGQHIDNAASIAAINQLADYVAGIKGRKNLIWVGAPILIVRDGGLSWGVSDMTVVRRLMDLYDRFTREQIAIYPLDPGGLGNFNLSAADVAEQTGGTISGPSNDYKGVITKFVDQSSHFYTLSYVPTRPDPDGHFHPITIKVNRPGVHLSYRTGWNDEQPQPLDPIVKQRMIQGPMRLGALPTTQLLFDLEVQPTPPSNSLAYARAEATLKQKKNWDKNALQKSPKGTPYDVTFRFDPTQIAFSESPDGKHTANLEFDLGAYDLYSELLVARSQVIKISIPPSQYAQFMQTTFRFYLPIPLPKGQLALRAGLFDTVANTSGSFQLTLAVPRQTAKK
jgi:VWFA-related protein